MIAFGLAAITAALLTSPSTGTAEAADRISVVVSIPPHAYFAERLGGEAVEVAVLLQPGQSPHTFDASARQIATLSEADLFFTVGLTFEQALVRKIANESEGPRIVDTRKGVPLMASAGHSHDAGSGTQSDHAAGTPDPHSWLDPALVKIQVENIAAGLAAFAPDRSVEFEQNRDRLCRQLDSLDRSIGELLKPYRGRKIYVFHAAFGYFATRYGLEQVAVEVEGKEPSARLLTALIEQMRRDSVTTLFVQPQFSRKTAVALAEAAGCRIVELDPLAADYPANLLDIAVKIKDSFSFVPQEP